MTVARQYVLVAKLGESDVLHAALMGLAVSVQAIQGIQGVDLFRDAEQPERFIFIERWSSIEAHKVGGKQLPKSIFAAVMAAIEQPPEACYLESVPLD